MKVMKIAQQCMGKFLYRSGFFDSHQNFEHMYPYAHFKKKTSFAGEVQFYLDCNKDDDSSETYLTSSKILPLSSAVETTQQQCLESWTRGSHLFCLKRHSQPANAPWSRRRINIRTFLKSSVLWLWENEASKIQIISQKLRFSTLALVFELHKR